MDLIGPFPAASVQRRFLLVAIDYFPKWVEAEPLASITDNQVHNFLWKNIITYFDILRTRISDNGSQFNSGPTREYFQIRDSDQVIGGFLATDKWPSRGREQGSA